VATAAKWRDACYSLKGTCWHDVTHSTADNSILEAVKTRPFGFCVSDGILKKHPDNWEIAKTWIESLFDTGFLWATTARRMGCYRITLQRFWENPALRGKGHQETEARLIDEVDWAAGQRLINAGKGCNELFGGKQHTFDGLIRCGDCRTRLKRTDCNTGPGWHCRKCYSPKYKVHELMIKRTLFQAMQSRLPQLARLCEHRNPIQLARQQEWLKLLGDYVNIGQRLQAVGMRRMKYPLMAVRNQLAMDQLGELPNLERQNWVATFSQWGAWEQASDHQWRLISTFFIRSLYWDPTGGGKIRLQLFRPDLVDPAVMERDQRPGERGLFPVDHLPLSHPGLGA